MSAVVNQRLSALDAANAVRFECAAIKREVRALRTNPALLQVAEGLEAGSLPGAMRLWDLLLAVPRYGEIKAGRLLGRHMIGTRRRLADLTVRQRVALGRDLRREARRWPT